jgi:hypothetical protein
MTTGSGCEAMEGFLRSHTMGSTNVAGKDKELGETCGSKALVMVRRDCEDGDEGLMGCSFCGDGCKMRVA